MFKVNINSENLAVYNIIIITLIILITIVIVCE